MKQLKTSLSLKSMQKPLLIVALSLAWSTASWATVIEYTVTNQGGNTWEYDYTITNDSLLPDFVDATIYFPTDIVPSGSNQVTNIFASGLTQPSGWTASEFQWGAGLGGYVDFSSTAALAAGASVGLFHVTFDYSGAGTPGSQAFEIYDSNVNLTDSGNTVLHQSCTDPNGCTPPMPEPSELVLLTTGILGFFGAFARKRMSVSTTSAV